MKIMKLYLIRHGESENNKTGCYTGWTDASLTEKGIEDAKGVRKYIADVKFDKIYSSDLSRAKKTAETAIPGCDYEETPLIRELNLGELEGKEIALCPEMFGEEFLKNRSETNYKPYGGENDAELVSRIEAFLNMVANSGYETVAAFSHGGFLRRSADYVLGIKLPRGNMPCRNCAIEILEYTDGKWKLHSWINTK
ncbi:MAG: histidine phosphatase family protein [Ruminococcaceae bacterium]|nr:histidine phosphatase family protein [Oscillospiraceae bacterium]